VRRKKAANAGRAKRYRDNNQKKQESGESPWVIWCVDELKEKLIRVRRKSKEVRQEAVAMEAETKEEVPLLNGLKFSGRESNNGPEFENQNEPLRMTD